MKRLIYISLGAILIILGWLYLHEEETYTKLNNPRPYKGWEHKYINQSSSRLTGNNVKIAILDMPIGNANKYNIIKEHSFISDKHPKYVKESHADEIMFVVSSVAKDVKFYHGVVVDTDYNVTLKSLLQGINWAIEQDVDIINLSLNFPYSKPDSNIEKVFKKAYDKGIIIIASTGNDGIDQVLFPATSQYVIGVGGSTFFNKKMSISNYGADVDFCMPGEYITINDLNTSKSQKEGTSYAAALLSGLTALVKEKNPDYNQSQLIYKLRNMSTNIERNDFCGYGTPIFTD